MVRCAGFEDVREHGRFRMRFREGAAGGPHVVVHAEGAAAVSVDCDVRGPAGCRIRVGYCGGPRLMSRLRKWWVMIRNPQGRRSSFRPGSTSGPGSASTLRRAARFRMRPGVRVPRGFRSSCEGRTRRCDRRPARLHLRRADPVRTTIEIGERCIFGQATRGRRRRPPLPRPRPADARAGLRPARRSRSPTASASMAKCTIIAGDRRAHRSSAPTPWSPATAAAHVVAVGLPARPIDYFGPPGGRRSRAGDRRRRSGSSASAQAERKSGASS